MVLAYLFGKDLYHGEGQQLSRQGQEEGQGQGAREEESKEKVTPGGLGINTYPRRRRSSRDPLLSTLRH